MNEVNSKTVFVLDHTHYFGLSSEEYISLDFLKGKASHIKNVDTLCIGKDGGPCSKSLWTCCVESSVEYCRIVWDLFPKEKLIRFLISDTSAHIANTWSTSTQNVAHVLNAMGLVGAPPPPPRATSSAEYSVVHGLRGAVEALSEPSERQLLEMQTGNLKVSNKGRVICLTSASDNMSMKSLEDIFFNVLLQQNLLASSKQNHLLIIEKVHLIIINVVPYGVESLVSNRGLKEISPLLYTEIHTTIAPEVSKKLTHLIMSHYDLASTTVTGIPMKEEQNANSSANYDVEILHARNAHTVLCGNELPTSIKEGAEYETVTLKWCTPRGGGAETQLCLALHRVTPVDVTSRPSSCLINFLLIGRSVLLEMPRSFRKTGGKITSHLLSAQGGEIFIHALQITRSCLDEIPSISETPGGRTPDYRVLDLAVFAKHHRFVPLKNRKPDENLARSRERFQRRSLYFPLTMTSSMLYNVMLSTEFLRRVTKENMEKSDEIFCQQQIFDTIYTPAKYGDMLSYKYAGFKRMKDSKKAEQYKLLILELEQLLRCYGTTPHHRTILDIVKNLKHTFVTNGKNENENTAHSKSHRAITDSPLSPPHSMDSSHSISHQSCAGSRSLLDIFLQAERSQIAKRLEFTGRLCTPLGQVAKLYPHLDTKEKSDSATQAATA